MKNCRRELRGPRLPELEGVDLHAVNHPAKEVAGDFYDWFTLDADTIVFSDPALDAAYSPTGASGAIDSATTE